VTGERVVVVTDHPWPSVEAEVEALARVGAEPLFAPTGAEEELVELVRDAEAILTCFALVTPRVVRAGRRLQVIGRYGVGVDNIAVAEATALGIPVTNVPSYCEHEVAEHALALMLALARRVLVFDRGVRAGDWSLGRGQPIHRIAGSTLGIVGFGHIGRTLAGKAKGLGMRVVVHHPRLPGAQLRAAGVDAVSLDELAAEADFVSLHVPLSEETRHIVDSSFLRAMKRTAFLVNTARGAVVDRNALVEALRRGWIAGAALDVFEPERLAPDDPLLAAPNLIATPHVAYYSEESLVDLGRLAAENVAAVLDGRRPAALVNPEVLATARWSRLSGAA
jgi:D-3-phosphoglycerate dehydrogenase / 2-oxoglutarate reductase